MSALHDTLHDAVTWPVHTARLTLRPATCDDWEATWAIRRLPQVSEWLTRAPATAEEYRQQFDEPDSLAKTIIIELDGQVIGDLMLDVQDGWGQAEVADQARATQADLGWVLHPKHTGHGYATEAVQALLEVAFTDLGLRRVTASCFADNEASWRLMERLGMSRETYAVAESLHRSGQWLDSMIYALLADDARDSWTDTPA
jgi:RimJ/RimL family protein N-acetyltransferase